MGTHGLERSWLWASAGCELGGGEERGGGGWLKLSGVPNEEAEPGTVKGEVSGSLTIVPKGPKHKKGPAREPGEPGGRG